MTGGFQRGDLVILAARPSMGKTTFALNCALNACREHGACVLFFSLEMGQHQILTNMLARDRRHRREPDPPRHDDARPTTTGCSRAADALGTGCRSTSTRRRR